MKDKILYILLVTTGLLLTSCTNGRNNSNNTNTTTQSISNDSLLTLIQYRTFQYFWEGAEPVSGMARERIHMDNDYPQQDKNVVTTGGSGFGLMAILVGINRGFITREEGLNRYQRIVKFLASADRFHGAWPHWLYGETGKVKPFSKYDDGGDIVETAYLVQGLLAVKQYFTDGNAAEQQLAADIDKLWRGVEWNWYQKDGESVLYWHWSPDYGWKMNFPLQGYNECLIAYVLGASSPSFPITAEAYHKGWARDGAIVQPTSKYGYKLNLRHNGSTEYGGPLFWAHYSYLGLDPRNLKDQYASYWEENRNQVLIDREYCIKNPGHYKCYGPDCWGLTASYSIQDYESLKESGRLEDMQFSDDPPVGYTAHQPSNDRGVISPTAALSSFPYAPKECMQVARFLYDSLADKLMGPYGFYDAFSCQYNWFPEKYLAIDQGPIPVMIENYRTALLWNLFMKNEEVQQGLDKLGFTYK